MTGTTTKHGRRETAGAIALCCAAAVILPACAPERGPTLVESFREVPSPAGPGSGEPHLSLDGGDAILSWLEPVEAGEGEGDGAPHALRMARLVGGEAWRETQTVARSNHFFVNWADFPSVVPIGPGLLAAHWLVRGPEGGYDYAVHVALSGDDGRSWSESWTPHEDATPTEHGFVSLFPLDGGRAMGMIWLDGRDFAAAGEERRPEMALRFRRVALGNAGGASFPADSAGPEVVVDARVCDCCQTAAAATSHGIVAVYRDRSPEEVRDISSVRLDGSGSWSAPVAVHDDGWVINACPVNGPAIAADGESAVVAWFTAAGDAPAVRAAFSHDAGASFDPPVGIDGGNPAGRVGVALLDDGSALVSWLERAGDGAEVRVRRVSPDGRAGPARSVAASSASRASGFPRMVVAEERAVFAWTDPADADGAGRVRVATTAIPPLP